MTCGDNTIQTPVRTRRCPQVCPLWSPASTFLRGKCDKESQHVWAGHVRGVCPTLARYPVSGRISAPDIPCPRSGESVLDPVYELTPREPRQVEVSTDRGGSKVPRVEGCALPSRHWVRSPQGLAEAGPLLLTPGVSLTTCPDESSKDLRVLPGMGGRQQGSRGSGAGGVGVPSPSRFSSWQSQSRSPSRPSGLGGTRGRGASLVRGVWQVVRRAVS